MKILLITNMYPGRNKECMYAGIFVKEQIEALQKNTGAKFDVFVIDGHLGKANYLKSAFKILKKIQLGNYDVIHAHYGLSALFALFKPFTRWRNVYLTLHGGDILPAQGKWLQVFLTRQIAKRVFGVITINDEMTSAVSRLNKNIRLIPCGVDTHFFQRPRDNSERQNRFLFAGSPKRWVKNYPLFEKILVRYQEIYGTVDIIALDGFNREQIRDLLSSSSVLLMTSHSEGSPQIIKEALSCDTPIVSTNVGDVKAVLGDTPGTAIINTEASINETAELVHRTILESKQTLGARRNRLFQMGLDEEKVSKNLEKYYKECL